MIASYIERWHLHKRSNGHHIEILRDGDRLEWFETDGTGRTTGRGGEAAGIDMPGSALIAIRHYLPEGYELVAHEQYDPADLAKYLTCDTPVQLALDLQSVRGRAA